MTLYLVMFILSIIISVSYGITDISPITPYLEIVEPIDLAGMRFPMASSNFSMLPPESVGLEAYLSLADPLLACGPLKDPSNVKNTIVLVERGQCQFWDKVQNIEKAGAVGYLIANVVDDILPTPVLASTGRQFTPLPGGAVLGADGTFIKTLLDQGVPIRAKMYVVRPFRSM